MLGFRPRTEADEVRGYAGAILVADAFAELRLLRKALTSSNGQRSG